MLQGHGPFPWSHRESNSDLIFRRDLFYPLNYETPLYAIVYAKMLPTSAEKACFQFAKCSYILCKDVANECKESLLSICRVQLYLMQRYNNLSKECYFQSINLNISTEVQNASLNMTQIAMHRKVLSPLFQQPRLFVIIRSTISSVAHMASLPMLVKFRMLWSTHSSIMPSAAVTCRPSRANNALKRAVLTPEHIFKEQLGLAPSHIIPVRLAIMFFTAWHTSWKFPPMR